MRPRRTATAACLRPASASACTGGAGSASSFAGVAGRRPSIIGRAARRVAGAAWKPVEQALLERRRAGQRHAGEKAGVEAERDAPRQRPAPRRPGRAGPIRRRRASASWRRRPARRPAAPAPATSPRRPHRRAAEGSDARALSAAPVRIRPEDRPGAGRPEQARRDAQQQRRRDGRAAVRGLVADCDRRAPSATSGARQPVGQRGKQQRQAEQRQQRERGDRGHTGWPATAQPPPTAASVATAAKVTAMPASIGSPLRRNGWSARAKTKGSTGRMHGLTMVSDAAEIGQAEQDHGEGFRCQAVGGLEGHGDAVHAIAQAGRLGPSSKTWPRWPPQRRQWTAVRTMPKEWSRLCRRPCPAAPRSSASPCRCRISSSRRTGQGRSPRRRKCRAAARAAGGWCRAVRSALAQHRVLIGRQQLAPFRVGALHMSRIGRIVLGGVNPARRQRRRRN